MNRSLEPNLRELRPLLRAILPAILSGFLRFTAGAEQTTSAVQPAELFQLTNVWNVHLRFTPDQWQAMEPKGAANSFGGPGPRGGGPGGFGPAMFIAPAFLKGDENHDGKLSSAEFRAVGEKWFAAWDKSKSGKLTADDVRTGLNSTLALPEFGPARQNGPGGPGPGLQGSNGRNGLSAVAGIEFEYVHADLEFGGQLLQDIAVRYKGNNTFMEARDSIKRSFKLDLNKYVKGQKLAGLTKLNLHNNVNDPSWMNEVLSYRLFRDAGVPAPRTAYARVFVSVPDKFDKQYFGLYSVIEDIDRHFAEDRFGSKKGAIFKPVTRELFAYLGDNWAKYAQIYDPKTELSEAEKNRVIEFAKFFTNATDPDFAASLGQFVDLDEFARFMSVTVWLSNLDSILAMGQNYYLYLNPESRKFEFLPWDLDHSFGQFPMGGTQEEREKLSIQKPWRGNNRFLERVFKVEAFKTIYLAKLKEFSQTIFIPDRFFREVDEIAAAIRPAVRDESDTSSSRFEKAAAGETVEPVSFSGPGASEAQNRPRFRGPGGFMQSSKPIKPFVCARAESVVKQLAGNLDVLTEAEGSFGGRGDRGPRGPGGPGGFGPARMLERSFMDTLDLNKDQVISHEEFTNGFAKWFAVWDVKKTGAITDAQLRAGINRDLSRFHDGPPHSANFEAPGGSPPFGP